MATAGDADRCCDVTTWDPRRRHLPPSKKLWDSSVIVTQTGESDQPARYSPDVRDHVEELELGTVGHNPLPLTRPHVHRFYRDTGQVIGASKGQLTSFIYVECTSNGAVHGRPITWNELVLKGAEA